MRKNKFLLKLSILILVITAVAVVKFQTSNEVLAQSNLTDNSANNIGSNVLCDEIIVTLTKEETLKFIDYTKEDFSDVGAIAIKDLTEDVLDWVKDKTLNNSTDGDMLINVEKFKRILCIKIDNSSIDNLMIYGKI